MKIRFHGAIMWTWKPIVTALTNMGYVYGTDMQGLQPKNDASYLEFYNEDAYNKALEILKALRE
jgi:hypothetical protein